MPRVPEDGDFLTIEDVEMIYNLMLERKRKNLTEPTFNTLAAVLLRVGELFTPITCLEQEWSCLMKDMPTDGEGEPRCPNGHTLEKGAALKLAWVPEDYSWIPDEEVTTDAP